MSSSNPTYFHVANSGGYASGDELDNVIIGSDFDDYLGGWDGNDTLEGGFGDDTLDGGAGDDLMTGGEGLDRFELRIEEVWDEFGNVSHAGFGQDVITDFSDGDMLEIMGWGTGGLNLSVSWTDTDTILTAGTGTDWQSSVVLEAHFVDPLATQQSGEFFAL